MANFFNLHLAKQSTPIENGRSIPTKTNCLCDAITSAVDFEDQDVLKIIRALDIKKAHGHDNISKRLINVCHSSIVKPLSIIFRNYLISGIFPNNWITSSLVPVYKKGNKQLLQNYHPVPLFPISGKIFKRLNLFCSNQSGFRKTDSCVNQTLCIIHEIYESFNNFPSLETCSGFLDMSKAFHRV